jgi:hypothetical protein
MKEVPKKDEEEVGGGTLHEPRRLPPDTYPPMPGLPIDPPLPGPYDPVSTT